MEKLNVYINKKAEERVLNNHPWIFQSDITKRDDGIKNGDIVVALVDDSATVKTYYKEEGRYRLQPENDSMDPIYVNEVVILGTVVGLFRLY